MDVDIDCCQDHKATYGCCCQDCEATDIDVDCCLDHKTTDVYVDCCQDCEAADVDVDAVDNDKMSSAHLSAMIHRYQSLSVAFSFALFQQSSYIGAKL